MSPYRKLRMLPSRTMLVTGRTLFGAFSDDSAILVDCSIPPTENIGQLHTMDRAALFVAARGYIWQRAGWWAPMWHKTEHTYDALEIQPSWWAPWRLPRVVIEEK